MIDRIGVNTLEVIGDIGATNASKFLSQMLNKKFRVSIPWVGYATSEKIPGFLGEPEDLTTCIHLSMNGDLKGDILLIFPQKSAFAFTCLLQNKRPSKTLDDMDRSALKEAGNILANAYLNAIAEKLNVRVQDSVPNLATDMLYAVIDCFLGDLSSKSSNLIVLKNDYKIENEDIEAHVLILFDPKSYKKLLGCLSKCVIKSA